VPAQTYRRSRSHASCCCMSRPAAEPASSVRAPRLRLLIRINSCARVQAGRMLSELALNALPGSITASSAKAGRSTDRWNRLDTQSDWRPAGRVLCRVVSANLMYVPVRRRPVYLSVYLSTADCIPLLTAIPFFSISSSRESSWCTTSIDC
jgi:hypothetical protein